jgi:hypothetical protein
MVASPDRVSENWREICAARTILNVVLGDLHLKRHFVRIELHQKGVEQSQLFPGNTG